MRNGWTRGWMAAVLLVSGASEVAGRQETGLPEERTSRVIGFRVAGRSLIVVDGRIGPFDGLTLMIDTGTPQSVVDRSLAGRFRNAGSGAHRLIAPFVQFGPVYEPRVPVLASDLHGLSAGLGVRLDAIIGLDVLRGRCLIIDYAARTLTFGCSGGSGPTVALARRGSRVLIDVTIDGQQRRLLLDTGAEAILLFERAAPAARLETSTSTAAALGGSLAPLRRFNAEDVSVGGHDLGPRPVFVAADPAGRVDYDGVFGVRWLATRILLDLDRMRIGWESQ